MSTASMPKFKDIHQYLVPQSSKNLKNPRISKFSIKVFGSFRHLTKMKMVSFNLHWKAKSNRPQLLSKQPTFKFDLI